MTMTDENQYDVLNSNLVALSDSSVVHGVALGEGDVTRGMSNKPTLWPGSTLESAADELRGKPLVKDHPGVRSTETGVQVDPQPPAESVIGEVTDSKYEEGVGLLFEAEVDDEEILSKIENGRLEVSPVVARQLGEMDPETDAHRVESISGFRDLGVVSRGASPSNYINPGAATAMSAEALHAAFDTDSAENVTNGDDGDGGDTPQSNGDPETENTTMAEQETVTVSKEEYDGLQETVDSQEETIAEQAEQIESIKEDFEALQEDYEALEDESKSIFTESLAEKWGTDEEKLKDNFSLEALKEEFEDEDGNVDKEALIPTPKGGQPDPSEQDAEALSDEEAEEVELLEQRVELFEGRGWEAAAELNKEKLADITGEDSDEEGE